jgi:hypothetical protein
MLNRHLSLDEIDKIRGPQGESGKEELKIIQ